MAPSVLTVLVGGTIVAIVALGWLVPLIIGIVRSIKGQRSPGLIIFGALWGSVGLFFGFIAVFGLFAYRGAKAHTDVKPFDAVQAGDQVATLTVPFEGDVELRFVSEAGDETQTYTTKGEAGAVPVPAGEITPISLILTGPDEDGKTWTASTFLKGRRRKPRTLAAGESQDLSIGPPFEARVALSGESAGKQFLDFKLKGAAGNPFTIRGPGGASKAPSFEVADEKDEIVWHGKFAYG